MADFARRSLSDLLGFVVDNRGRTCPTVESGFPLIATNCVVKGSRRIAQSNVRYVDEETKATWFRAHPEPGDVLFVCKGNAGRVAVVPDPVSYCIAQDMVALRADPALVDPLYLYYRLLSPDAQARITDMHVGSLIPHFKKGDFKNLFLDVHTDLDEQRRISGVLGALDDLIETNQQLIADCEAQWRHIVQRASTICGTSLSLSSLAEFTNGKNFTKAANGTGRPVIRTPEVRRGPYDSTIRSDVEADSANIATAGDMLFVWSGSLMVDRWRWEDGLVNQHIFKVVPRANVPDWLIMFAVEAAMGSFLATAADKATTMGHIRRADLDKAILLPDRESWKTLNSAVSPLWEAALSLHIEADEAARTRDELLPLMMSGQVRVADVEDRVAL